MNESILSTLPLIRSDSQTSLLVADNWIDEDDSVKTFYNIETFISVFVNTDPQVMSITISNNNCL